MIIRQLQLPRCECAGLLVFSLQIRKNRGVMTSDPKVVRIVCVHSDHHLRTTFTANIGSSEHPGVPAPVSKGCYRRADRGLSEAGATGPIPVAHIVCP
jgi:hypothetical protein